MRAPTRSELVAAALGAAMTVGLAVAVAEAPDQLKITNEANGSVDDAIVYLSGNHYDGCFCEFFKSGTHSVGTNVTSGPSQLAVLSDTYGLLFVPSVEWEPYPGETQEFTVQAPIELSLKVWILWSPGSPVADKDLMFAKDAMKQAQTGIRLSPATIEDRRSLQLDRIGCEDQSTLDKLSIFDQQAVNVYYADNCPNDSCSDFAGVSCNDRRLNFVYSDGAKNTMLHELGHALLGRDHWKMKTVGVDNIMRDRSAENRLSISTGQAIAMNYDASSVVNKLVKRSPFTPVDSANRPRLEFDRTWTDCVAPAPSPEQPTNAIQDWYDCIECTGGELERLLTEFDLSTLLTLAKELNVDGKLNLEHVSAAVIPIVAGNDDPYHDNEIARRQRRAVSVLSALARRGDRQARLAIRLAYAQIGGYRTDVQQAIRRAFQLVNGTI